jgi:hypothetical protein
MNNYKNISEIFSDLENQRIIILNSLYYIANNLHSLRYSGLLPKDNCCLFKMGENFRLSFEEKLEQSYNAIHRNHYKCKHCLILSNLLGLNIGVGIPLSIKSLNNKFIINMKQNVYPISVIGNNKIICTENDNNINVRINDVICKNIEGVKNNYIELDPFTNNVLINWEISNILKKGGISNMDKLHMGFICSDIGYTLEEYNEEINLRTLENEDIYEIIKQLFEILYNIKERDFIIGNIKVNTLKIIKTGGGLSVQLNDFSSSSINLNTEDTNGKVVRLYKKEILNLSIPDIHIENTKLFKKTETLSLYKIKKGIHTGLHYGNLPYRTSLNAYMFIVMLYNEKNIKNCIISNTKLREIWQKLWLPSEIESIEKIILELGDPNEHKILNLLEGKTLRYDALDMIWQILN